MQLITKVKEIEGALQNFPRKKIVLVPTMGALHEGHLSLVKKAKEVGDIVVVSIFVNQAQFNDQKDYEKYPRQLEEDLKKLENFDIDYVFAPSSAEMNQVGYEEFAIPNDLKNCLCGKARIGHFEGVVMIVSKLFHVIKPHIAIFGQKDFQQLLIIKNFVQTTKLNIEIIPFEIIRESSGLAMSSRNQNLSYNDKILAANIYKILLEIRSEVTSGQKNISDILSEKSAKLLTMGFEKIDYLEIRQESDLKLITNISSQESMRIFIAVYLSKVRLIDNVSIQKFNLL